MPPTPLPPELEEFVARPNIAVVATVRRDGPPHTVAMRPERRHGWNGPAPLDATR